jgi:4-hydroxymandelate oxidase
VLTVDLPVLGYRERDRRNSFTQPGPWDRSFSVGSGAGNAGGGPEPIGELYPGTLTWHDIAAIRSWAPELPLVLKGILHSADARLAIEHGADAIVVSNHGARQLDRVTPAVDALEEVAEAIGGRCELWVDGGVRRGLDVAIALSLGARGVLLGRPVLWALAAAGEAGVARALSILREELEIALALLGTPTPGDVTRAHAGP